MINKLISSFLVLTSLAHATSTNLESLDELNHPASLLVGSPQSTPYHSLGDIPEESEEVKVNSYETIDHASVYNHVIDVDGSFIFSPYSTILENMLVRAKMINEDYDIITNTFPLNREQEPRKIWKVSLNHILKSTIMGAGYVGCNAVSNLAKMLIPSPYAEILSVGTMTQSVSLVNYFVSKAILTERN